MEKGDQGSCPGKYFFKISDFQFNLNKNSDLGQKIQHFNKK